MCLQYKSLENTMGKGEIARNVSVFYLFQEFSAIHLNFKIVVQTLSVRKTLKFVVW